MVMRFDPFKEFDRMLGGHAFGDTIAMDAYQHGDEIRIDFELPGVQRNQIDLTVERGVLTVTARRGDWAQDGAKFIAQERARGPVTRRLYLGDSLDLEDLQAELHDGVLSVQVPLKSSAKPRQVEIRESVEPVEAIGGEASPVGGA